jgi:hypothetical protein
VPVLRLHRFEIAALTALFFACGGTRSAKSPAKVPEQKASAEEVELNDDEVGGATGKEHDDAAPATVENVPAAAGSAYRPKDLDDLRSKVALVDRRFRFGRAVEALSAATPRPISAARARKSVPCGGWAGPGCSSLTKGIEVARAVIPIAVASFDLDHSEVTAILAEAVAEHAVWHDAYGYLYKTTRNSQGERGFGPGYIYAGCLFGSCDPADPLAGQVDGILYQIARITGLLEGAPCGPDCTLKL